MERYVYNENKPIWLVSLPTMAIDLVMEKDNKQAVDDLEVDDIELDVIDNITLSAKV